MGDKYEIFLDRSVDTGDISDDLSDESIRRKVRDEYLRDSTVTILLVGLQTKRRKHVDWEIYSSMIDGCILRLKRDTDSERKGTVIPNEKGH